MKRENAQLQEQIRLLEIMSKASKLTVTSSDGDMSAEEQKEIYKKRSKTLVDDIQEMEAQINQKAQEIDHQRSSLGGVNAASANIDAIDKSSKILENRLDKALVKYNKSLATNKRLRVMIDNLRRERVTFDKLARKFEKEVAEQKRIMQELIEQSNAAYEARDEAQNRISTLREKAEKEYQTYIQEIKDLDRNIEHDRKLREFLSTKSVDRTERMEEVDGLEKKNKREKHSLNARANSHESLNIFFEQYDRMLKEIENATGIKEIKKFIQHFKAMEEDNFALFVYVNEVNNECEKLSTEHRRIAEDIEALKKQESMGDALKSQQVKQLEEELEKCQNKSVSYEAKNAESTLVLQTLVQHLEKMVDLCKAIPSPFVDEQESTRTDESEDQEHVLKVKCLLGCPNTKLNITNDNILQVLGLIEQEASDVITLNYIFGYGKKGNNNMAATTQQQAQLPQAPSSIVVAPTGDGTTANNNGEFDVTTAKVSMPLPGTVVKLLSTHPQSSPSKLSIVTPSTT